MAAPLSALILAALVASGAQAGGDQDLLYDIFLGNERVGTREVTLRVIDDAGGGSTRVIESYMELQTQVAGMTWRFANRATARVSGGTSSFTSSVSENGVVREVQARQRRDGAWKVTVVEDGEVKQASLPKGQVDLSSLHLLDSEARRDLTARARASVLVAETGTVISGTVDDLGEGTLSLGGQDVAVHRWAWTTNPGRFELAWSMDGQLVAYDTSVMGKSVSVRLRDAPAARTFGEIDALAPVIGAVSEQEL